MRVEKENSDSEVVRIRSRPILGRIRLLARWSKFALWSLRKGHFVFFWNAINALLLLIFFSLRDIILRQKNVTCNICGWNGYNFYPNVCAGYYKKQVLCPGCDCLDRYRTFVAILKEHTEFFSPDTSVIEVAPVRRFQEYCLRNKNNKNYVSFDIERFAMEKGDIADMRYEDNVADYFLCSDVLDYVENDAEAFREVWRVLKPGGLFIFRVAVDWDAAETREYGTPDSTFHLRLYGRDIFEKTSTFGFDVNKLAVAECVGEQAIKKFSLCREPLFFAKKVTR